LTLEPAERVEAVTRLIEEGVVDFIDGTEALRMAGHSDDDMELLEVAARARLADIREFHEK
jgi:hypothetical protein